MLAPRPLHPTSRMGWPYRAQLCFCASPLSLMQHTLRFLRLLGTYIVAWAALRDVLLQQLLLMVLLTMHAQEVLRLAHGHVLNSCTLRLREREMIKDARLVVCRRILEFWPLVLCSCLPIHTIVPHLRAGLPLERHRALGGRLLPCSPFYQCYPFIHLLEFDYNCFQQILVFQIQSFDYIAINPSLI